MRGRYTCCSVCGRVQFATTLFPRVAATDLGLVQVRVLCPSVCNHSVRSLQNACKTRETCNSDRAVNVKMPVDSM